jgi:hypothetical protein
MRLQLSSKDGAALPEIHAPDSSCGSREDLRVAEGARANKFVNPLPGVPDVESPFYEILFAEKDLSPELRRIASDLRENGFAVFDFPDPELFARIDRIVASLAPTFDFAAWRKSGWQAGQGLRVQDAWNAHADVQAIASNTSVLEMLTLLYGRQAFPFQTLNFPVGTQQSLHTDSVHFSSVPERFMCGVWVAFEDIDEDNGPLEYYPGSHKLPIYVNEHINACASMQAAPDSHYADFTRLWRELVAVHGLERRTFHARKGQALIWSANLLHGGSRQRDPARTRWSQVTHYYFEGCAYYTPLLSDPAFGSTFYRDIIDVANGQAVPNVYSGHKVDHDVMARAVPGFLRRKPASDNSLPPGFDPKAYLAANPDVARAGQDPIKHWQTFGWKEGRPLR